MKHKKIPLDKILFIDIETVSAQKSYKLLSSRGKDLWLKKAKAISRNPDIGADLDAVDKLYEDRSAIYAEFGKVVCITVGYMFEKEGKEWILRLKSFAGENEQQLLTEFASLLNKHYRDPGRQYMCGHNIKEFDVPYLCRRFIINQIDLPAFLDVSGKKPWDLNYLLDTLHLWRFGDFKNYTSLDLLCYVMKIPSPKGDIDGSEVGHVYWEEQDIARIAKYCEQDVISVAQLFLRFTLRPLLENFQITVAK